MAATIKELKEMIVDLKMDLINESIPITHCHFAYYINENPEGSCDDISCKECRQIFLDEMREDIKKEVMAL